MSNYKLYPYIVLNPNVLTLVSRSAYRLMSASTIDLCPALEANIRGVSPALS